ncbi:hypothetical protein FRC07_012287 [Ceratobasidium sp. 392]|nr:hypothetical protein FRC07_012287 [Ceratobasidium sp. 392]
MECLGYDHLDNPVLRPRNPRFKRQSPAESEPPLVAGPSLEDVAGSSASAFLGSFPEYPAPNIQQSHLALPGETWSFPAPNLFDERRLGSGLATSLNKSSNVPLLSGQPPSTQLDGLDVWWNAGLGPSDQSLGVPQLLEPTLNHQPDIYLHSDTFLGLGDSQTSTGASSSAVSQLSPSFQGSALPSPTLERDDSPSIMDEDSDTEGVMAILGPALALDRNVPSNALPFIISSYLRWAIRTMFEPRKVAQRTRDHLIKRFIRSDESRSGTTLVATIMESRLRDAAISASHSPEVKILEGRVYRKLAMIKSSQEPLPDSHASDVLAVLHGLYDMIAVVCQARPLSHFMRLLREITPVYRMACSEPIGAPIHLQAKLLHPESVLRHFPVIDIMMSLTSGRPTFLRYDVTDIPEFYEQANQIANFGMQWMYGVPDQFLIMLARMHMLRDNFAPNVDPQVVKEFETEIENFKPALDESPDSYLKVARLTVQEGWRQTMYIYLYMVRLIVLYDCLALTISDRACAASPVMIYAFKEH